MKTTHRLAVLVFALAAFITGTRAAETYKAGDIFAPFTTKDQHEKEFTYAGGARLVLVSFEMGTGKATNGFLENQPADFLDQHQALFIANIYGMPGIGRMFALPKMKKYPHRILLADAEGFLDRYPSKDDCLTVVELDPAGRVKSIRFVNPKKELTSVFAVAK